MDLEFKIRRATADDLSQMTVLLDGYRVFYQQLSDRASAQMFLRERFRNEDSIIFVAESESGLLGFTQLYPIFSTVSLESMMLLNDLYVDPGFRSLGIGSSLLEHAQDHIRMTRQKGLLLQTAADNPAQFLYEKLGWKKESDLFYFWKADA